jgi:hypothetical protein
MHRQLDLCHSATAAFYRLSTLCPYLTLYRLLVLCHYVHCCLLETVQCLSLFHTIPTGFPVSLCLLPSYTVCPLSVSTSPSNVCWFCFTISTGVFCSLTNLYFYVRKSSVFYVPICPLVPSTFRPLSFRTPHTVLSVGSV